MEEIRFKKEVCRLLGIPNIPKKEWDNETSFDNGVAVIKRITDIEDYAVCSFNSETDENVRIKKDFGFEPFMGIVAIYPVPAYMEDNIEDMDLDDDSSKEAMEELLQEKKEIVNEGIEKPKIKMSEWGYDFIKNKADAIAYLKTQNLKGRIPTNEEVLKAKLCAIYRNEQRNKNK